MVVLIVIATAMEKECKNFSKDFLESLRRLKRDEKLSDFVLKVGGEDIPVHRTVLSAASPYFEAMLSNDTVEKQRGWAEILDLDPNAVKTCIDFIYSGKAKLSLKNPELLIKASDLMQISPLKQLYFEFLLENVTIETCHSYLDMASKYSADEFVTTLQEYVFNNIDKILDSDYISKRSEDELREALNLLPSNLLNREIRKWKTIETWIKADVESRRENFSNLFKLLLLNEIPLECLAQEILVSEFVKNCDECRDAILHSLSAVKHRPQTQPVVPIATNYPLPPYTKKPTHLVALNNESSMLHSMDLNTYVWSRYAEIPFKLPYFQIISIRGGVYLASSDNRLVRYSSGKWEHICTLEKQLLPLQWFAFDDCIWFLEQNRIRKYNPVTGCWMTIPAVFPGVMNHTFAASKNCIMACEKVNKFCYDRWISGLTGLGKEFNFDSQKWKTISRPNLVYGDASILCAANEVFIMVGEKQALKYDPGMDDWVIWPNWSSPCGRIKHAASSIGVFCLIGFGSGALYDSNYSHYPLKKSISVSKNFSSFCFI